MYVTMQPQREYQWMQTFLPHTQVFRIRWEFNRRVAPHCTPVIFSTRAVTILQHSHTSCISLCTIPMECQLYHVRTDLVLHCDQPPTSSLVSQDGHGMVIITSWSVAHTLRTKWMQHTKTGVHPQGREAHLILLYKAHFSRLVCS